MRRPAALYRFWSADEELLYVGVTASLTRRVQTHAYQQPWWESVTRIDVEHFENRVEALAAERAAIRNEAPKFNIACSPRHVRPSIRHERIKKGLTLPDFAEAVGVSYRVARNAERGGSVRLEHANLLADFFGCEPIVFVEPARAAA